MCDHGHEELPKEETGTAVVQSLPTLARVDGGPNRRRLLEKLARESASSVQVLLLLRLARRGQLRGAGRGGEDLAGRGDSTL